MPLPLLLAPPPPGWEMFLRHDDVAPALDFTVNLPDPEGWTFPPALLTPMAALFGTKIEIQGENFLAGLKGENLLAARVLPAAGRRNAPLAGIAVTLQSQGRRLFADLRGGCWVPGFPVIGRGKELLCAAGLADGKSLVLTMIELGLQSPLNSELYFNFHPVTAATGCERVYVLDGAERRLYGFALPASALARAGANC